uniref:Enoyl-CoA hydratase n=1 Tax=Panagrellus redivivus TaxID=6233 RepID=A0A7E4VEF9_PANRE
MKVFVSLTWMKHCPVERDLIPPKSAQAAVERVGNAVGSGPIVERLLLNRIATALVDAMMPMAKTIAKRSFVILKIAPKCGS